MEREELCTATRVGRGTEGPDYAYVRVAETVAARIEVGDITHRLPPERDLAREFGVAYETVRRSMQVLRDRGLIITRQGRGTFVTPADRRGASQGSPSV
jgi:GntR family transcriptional regulator